MRIIGGKARGRKIKAPRGRETRPMRDFVREAVFSSVGDAVIGARVLDLFAGSGSLGLEALSRGAEGAVFVDSSAEAVRVIRENLEALGLAGRGEVVRAEVLAYLRRNAGKVPPFGLIFVDPPYKMDLESRGEILEELEKGGYLAPGALVIMQTPREMEIPTAGKGLRHVKRRRYGESVVDIYLAEPPEGVQE
jgi:16S rRNA (guanine(966)-N(2))-methyltransferase RsmD